MSDELHKTLIEYGKWTRHNPDRLHYPPIWFEMIMRDNTPAPPSSYTISDDEAMRIDKAVCALFAYSPLLYQVFALRYAYAMPEYKIAKITDERFEPFFEGKNRRNKVKQWLSEAQGFICGFLAKKP